jgi:hypothetical protein
MMPGKDLHRCTQVKDLHVIASIGFVAVLPVIFNSPVDGAVSSI